jgi:ATP-dependent Clp protease protease subunit
MFIPMVIEQTGRGERAMDLPSRLLRDRIIMLSTDVNEQTASIIVQQLLFLKSESDSDIHFYIQSPGGSVSHGLSIQNTMQCIINTGKCKVHTYSLGLVASMGSLIASSGSKGCRHMLEHSTHMMHSVSSGSHRATVLDLRVQMNETERLNTLLTKIYAKNTGKPIKTLEKDMARDFYLDAQESIDYGLADDIIASL